MRTIVVGAGMAGLLTAVRLRDAGFEDYVLYEKADRIGGTWRENTYPGIACDVPSHLYRYSFEPNPDWSQTYSPGHEIQAYFEGVAERRGLMERIRFGEEVTRAEFRDGRWRIETRTGRRDEGDFLIAATGVLHHPRIPEIEGMDSFGGACFHSARWDASVPVDGRRVAVVGNGSSGVQMTGALVPRVAQFSLFQRTAQWIMPQENPPYTDEDRQAFHQQPERMEQLRRDMGSLMETLSSGLTRADSPQMRMIQAACEKNLEESVRDPELRETLRPDYQAACKRLVISPNYYSALQQPNAEVVTEPIRRFEPAGIRTADGRLHELDVIVLATGFRVDRFMRPIEVVGRGGTHLDVVWKQRPLAYLSISIPDFPNLFMLNGPNGPVGNFSLIEVAELQMDYILQLMEEVRSGRCREISADAEATERFEAERTAAARNTIWATGCRSWYLDDRGVPSSWPWPFERFRAEMARPRPEAYERA